MAPAAIIGGVATLGGAAIQSSAAHSAAKAQTQAEQNAIDAQQGYYNDSQKNLQPFINTGDAASQKISDLQGLDGGNSSTIQATLEGLPGYQFAKTQGLKSVQNSATARGLGVSGAAQKGATTFAEGTANSYYNNLLQGLQNTQATGANAASGLATAATNTGNQVGSAFTGIGNAGAAADNATGQAFGNIGTNTVPSALLANKLIQSQNAATPTATSYLAKSSAIEDPGNEWFSYGSDLQ